MRNVPKASKPRKKILVVENDPDLCYILSLIFDDADFDYQIVNETLDLVFLVKQYQPDLVILDYRLPLVNGGELCLQLKNDCSTKDVPVIIYSAAPRAFISFKDYRQDTFLAKPFDLDDFMCKVSDLIEARIKA